MMHTPPCISQVVSNDPAIIAAVRQSEAHSAAVASAQRAAADSKAAFDDGLTQMMTWLHSMTQIVQQRLKQQQEHTEGMFQAAAFSTATASRAAMQAESMVEVRKAVAGIEADVKSQVEAFTAQAKSELDTVLQQLQLQKQRVQDRDQQLRDARKSVARLTDEVDRLRDASEEAARSHAAELQALQSRCDTQWHARYSDQAMRNQQDVQSLKAAMDRMHVQLQAVSQDKAELQVLSPARCCPAFPAKTHPCAGAALRCQPRAVPPQVVRDSADKRRPGVADIGVAQAGCKGAGVGRHAVMSRDHVVQV
jgi:chromosome segregation ATPase